MRSKLIALTAATAWVFTIQAQAANDQPFGTVEITVGSKTINWPVWTCTKKRISAHENIELDVAANEPFMNLLGFGDVISMRLAIDGKALFADIPGDTNLADFEHEGEAEGTETKTLKAIKDTFRLKVSCKK